MRVHCLFDTFFFFLLYCILLPPLPLFSPLLLPFLLPYLVVYRSFLLNWPLTMADIDVEAVLSKLDDREKISLLAGSSHLTHTTPIILLTTLQESTSGTPNLSPSMAYPPSASPTAQTASAAPASSTASPRRASPAEPH